MDAFVGWPTDLLRLSASLKQRLASRIAAETGDVWTDTDHDRVTMLVHLLPGVSYAPHTHAGVEELHLLEGELWIEDRLLFPARLQLRRA